MFTPFAYIQNIQNISAAQLQSLILFGNFTSYQQVVYNRIIKLNNSGSIDTSFNMGSGFDNTVYDVKIQPDNKVLVGGNYWSTYSGSSANIGRAIIRLNANGTIDNTFNVGGGTNGGSVYSIALQTDNKIVVAGSAFTAISGSTKRGIARLNISGSVDETFNPGTGITGSIVFNVLNQSDNKVIIAGNITGYSSSNAPGIVRINANGSLDVNYNVGTGFLPASQVYGAAIQTDDKVIVVGNFTSYSGSAINRIARLNTNGTLDTTFNVGTGLSTIAYGGIAIQPDGKILVNTLSNITYSGSIVNGPLVRINTNGTRDLTFTGSNATGMSASPNKSIVIAPDNGIYYVYSNGSNIANGVPTNYIAKLNSTGGLDRSFDIGYSLPSASRGFPGINNPPNGVTISGSTGLFIYGNYTHYKDRQFYKIVAIDIYGSVSSTKPATINSTTNIIGGGFANGNVSKAVITSDGNYVLGGNFLSYNNLSTTTRLVKINSNGERVSSFNIGSGPANTVNDIAIDTTDNSVYIVGTFTSYSGSAINRIAKITNTGKLDTTFNVGSGSTINTTTIAVQSDRKVLVAPGSVYSASINVGTLYRLNIDGTLDTAFSASAKAGPSIGPDFMQLQPDNKILIAGRFTTYNATSSNYICRVNPDGTRDTSFNIGTGFNNTVTGLLLQSNGKIMVMGQFTTYSGSASRGLARLNISGTLDTTFNPGTSLTSSLAGTIKQDAMGNYYIGGSFTTYQGRLVNNFVVIDSTGSIVTSYNTGSVGWNGSGSIGLNGNVTEMIML